jgi:hypothetical protein
LPRRWARRHRYCAGFAPVRRSAPPYRGAKDGAERGRSHMCRRGTSCLVADTGVGGSIGARHLHRANNAFRRVIRIADQSSSGFEICGTGHQAGRRRGVPAPSNSAGRNRTRGGPLDWTADGSCYDPQLTGGLAAHDSCRLRRAGFAKPADSIVYAAD